MLSPRAQRGSGYNGSCSTKRGSIKICKLKNFKMAMYGKVGHGLYEEGLNLKRDEHRQRHLEGQRQKRKKTPDPAVVTAQSSQLGSQQPAPQPTPLTAPAALLAPAFAATASADPRAVGEPSPPSTAAVAAPVASPPPAVAAQTPASVPAAARPAAARLLDAAAPAPTPAHAIAAPATAPVARYSYYASAPARRAPAPAPALALAVVAPAADTTPAVARPAAAPPSAAAAPATAPAPAVVGPASAPAVVPSRPTPLPVKTSPDHRRLAPHPLKVPAAPQTGGGVAGSSHPRPLPIKTPPPHLRSPSAMTPAVAAPVPAPIAKPAPVVAGPAATDPTTTPPGGNPDPEAEATHQAPAVLHTGRAPGHLQYCIQAVPTSFVVSATPAVAESLAVDPDPTGQQLYTFKGYHMFYDVRRQNWAYYTGSAVGCQWKWW